VGTNPLPNYVVGSYLKLKENYYEFVLIYSGENKDINQSSTKDYANKLKKHLNLDNCTLLPLSNVSNPNAIRDDLKEKFPKDNVDEVHLNYTGGTKTMAVHVYNFLKEKFNDKFNASYLNARTNELIYDDNRKGSVNLKDEIKIDIDIKTLLSIHLYNIKKLGVYDTYTYKQKFANNFDDISEKIKNAINNDSGKKFIEWVDNTFRKIFKRENRFLENNEEFQQHVRTLNDSNPSLIDRFNESPQFIWDILNAFPEDKKILKNNGFPDCIEDIEDIKYTVKFLDGMWLEWYVYNEIRSKLREKGLQDGKHFGISLEAKKENSSKSPNFELDIFIINGYQLVGISITTSDKQGDCKLKGFEVIHRVRQIGGDESKAILITGMEPSKKDALQEDLSFMTGTAEDKIVVFGVDDWADIGDKICGEVFQ
jgi:DNA-binding protein